MYICALSFEFFLFVCFRIVFFHWNLNNPSTTQVINAVRVMRHQAYTFLSWVFSQRMWLKSFLSQPVTRWACSCLSKSFSGLCWGGCTLEWGFWLSVPVGSGVSSQCPKKATGFILQVHCVNKAHQALNASHGQPKLVKAKLLHYTGKTVWGVVQKAFGACPKVGLITGAKMVYFSGSN